MAMGTSMSIVQIVGDIIRGSGGSYSCRQPGQGTPGIRRLFEPVLHSLLWPNPWWVEFRVRVICDISTLFSGLDSGSWSMLRY
jgi:hypothetical protein